PAGPGRRHRRRPDRGRDQRRVPGRPGRRSAGRRGGDGHHAGQGAAGQARGGGAGVRPVVATPLVSTFVVGALMLVVTGQPIAAVQSGLTDWLEGLSGSNAILLGIILRLMMAFDMGGQVNKVAYAFR